MNKILKLTLCVLIAITMLCSAMPVFAAGALSVEIEQTEDYRNKDITIAVDIKNNPGVAYLAMTLDYDKEYMTFVGAENGTVIKDFDQGTNLIWTADNNSTATGTLVSLTFKISLRAPVLGDSLQAVNLIVRECYDENFNDVSVNVKSGGIYPLCGHENAVPIPEIPATCDQDGYKAGIGCHDCPVIVEGRERIPATGKHEDADGKWESDSTKHFHTCSCGTTFDSAVHSGGKATCAEQAQCTVCGISYGTADASAHGETEVRNAISASCETDGYTGDTYCKSCGERIAAGTVIPATGKHIDADGKWETNDTAHYHTCACGTTFDSAVHSGGKATCIEKAQCTVCGISYGNVDKASHGDTELKDAVEATCDTDGYTGDTYCTGCGEKIAVGTVIPGGHKIEKVTAQEPTHDAPGNLEHYTCGGCGTLFADESGTQVLNQSEVQLPKGEHSYSDVWSSDDNAHWHGCDCGSKVDEAAHSYSDWTVVQEATEKADGSKTRTCAVCAHIQTEIIPASSNAATGDAAQIGLFAVLMAVSLCGIVAVVFLYPRRREKKEI